MSQDPFWKTTPLGEMSQEQWESLCDGCGKCCLFKLDDEKGRVYHTNISCKLLNPNTCQCSQYATRRTVVPDCITLTMESLPTFSWLPSSCAYKLLYEGKDLPNWHYLISGSRQTIHDEGMSVRGKSVSELTVSEDDYEDYIVDPKDL